MWVDSARAAFAELLPPQHEFPEPDPERWYTLIQDPAVVMLLADDGGEIAGFVTCGVSRDEDASDDVGEIRSIFVASRRWRSGVGRELLAAAFDSLRHRGYVEATLWSFAANDRANAFYEAQGFTRDGAEKTEEAWGHIPEVRYRRSI
jgi:ribosomal protein S18 acetylase RimI-like enzyme